MTDVYSLPELIAPDENDPRIQAVLDEFRQLILQHFPSSTFEVGLGEEPEGIRLIATVDVADLDEVLTLTSAREVELLVEEGIRVFVQVEWPEERLRAYLEQQRVEAAEPRRATSVAD